MKSIKYRFALKLMVVISLLPSSVFSFDLIKAAQSDKLAQSRYFSIDERKVLNVYDGSSFTSPVLQFTGDTLVVMPLVHSTTAVHNTISGQPVRFQLEQNFPNPFNPATEIRYRLSEKSTVSLVVYDITGKEITTLVKGEKAAGNYSVQWNASQYASGVYYYRMTASQEDGTSKFENKKMILTK